MDVNDHLRALEEALLTPALRRDPRRLATLLADDFREFGSSGRIWTKAETLEGLLTETPIQLQLKDFEAKPLAPEAVLVTYRVQRETLAATPVPEGLEDVARPAPSLRSSLWVQREGRWQMLFHQGTPAPIG